MPVKIEKNGTALTALISGELDHHSARRLREEIDDAVITGQVKLLILDFGGVGFMDSSGIGLVMGRYKLMQSFDGRVIVQNPSASIKKVMRLAGLDRLADITETKAAK